MRLEARLGLDGSGEAALYDVCDPGMQPEMYAELRLLERAVASMHARERRAFTLRYVEGCSLGVVAHACGCSLATTKRHLVSARRRLARAIGSPGAAGMRRAALAGDNTAPTDP